LKGRQARVGSTLKSFTAREPGVCTRRSTSRHASALTVIETGTWELNPNYVVPMNNATVPIHSIGHSPGSRAPAQGCGVGVRTSRKSPKPSM
jgi:hypothetical protein